MLFSVSYHSARKQEADELRCPINQIGQITELLKQGKRCLVTDVSGKDLDYVELDKLKDICDYTVSCGDPQLLLTLLDKGYKAFLRFPITDWESFQGLAAANVSDIYIDGPLGFQTKALKAGKGDIKLRVSPQVSSSAALTPIVESANTFYIRPEDLRLYEDIIDVIDFKEPNQEKEDVLFNIYKRGTWAGNLRDLVETLNQDVQNPFLKPEFCEGRLNCGQHCKIPSRSCHLCQTQFSLTNMVVEYFSANRE